MPETKEEFYKRIGMGRRIGFGQKPVVLAIDIQKGFTDPACPLGGNLDEMVKNAVTVINIAKERNVPVIYTVVAYMPDMSDAGIWGIKIPALKEFTIGSKWTELDDRMPYEPGKDFFIVKKMFSCFFGTQLLSILEYHKVDTIIAMGDSTSGCVRGTVTDGLYHGYRMIVPMECVGDRSKEAHEANLFDINGKVGDVVPMQEVITYLDGLK